MIDEMSEIMTNRKTILKIQYGLQIIKEVNWKVNANEECLNEMCVGIEQMNIFYKARRHKIMKSLTDKICDHQQFEHNQKNGESKQKKKKHTLQFKILRWFPGNFVLKLPPKQLFCPLNRRKLLCMVEKSET